MCNLLIDWPIDWLVKQLASWVKESVMGGLTEALANELNKRLIDWLTDGLIVELTERLSDQLNGLAGWLTDYLIDSMINIDWLIDRLTGYDWLSW